MKTIYNFCQRFRCARFTCLGLLAMLFLGAHANRLQAQEETAKVTVTGSGPDQGPVVVAVGEEGSIDFSAVINHDPTPHQECQLNGMSWSWTGSGGSLASNDSSATINFKFDEPGEYTVSASATTTFATSCGVDNNTHPGDNIVLSGSKSYTIKAVQKTWSPEDADGHEMTSSITAPAGDHRVILPGGKITVSVSEVTDSDTWIFDANGDDVIENSPQERGGETESVTYRWSGDGSFKDASAASTEWTAPAMAGRCTLICDISDANSAVGAHDAGDRNDDDIHLSLTIDVVSLSIQVKRVGMQDEQFGGSTLVAIGAKGHPEHEAVVRVTALDSDSNPAANLDIPVPTITNSKAPVVAHILETSGKTGASGTADFTFVSSNEEENPTISIPGCAGTASVIEGWDAKNDWGPDDYYFTYGSPTTVTFYPSLGDDQPNQTITGHDMKFKFSSITVTYWWKGDWKTETLAPGDGRFHSVAALASFQTAASSSPDTGAYRADLTVQSDDTHFIDSVDFYAEDHDALD